MKKFLVIVALAVILGLLNFIMNPNRPTLGLAADEITIQTALSFPKDTLVIDARSPKEFAESHVSDSINLSEEKFDDQIGNFLERWNPDAKVIVYCSSGSCNSSRNIANRLRDDFGIKNVFVLKGDWREWKR